MTPQDDARWMNLALTLGARGLGRVWPNPAVGCVIVRGGRVLGRGWTGDGGRPHAETVALAQAGEAARHATAYVTLEPCAHYGQTPPCAEALIAAGVARVVSALSDPDPRVAGRGHALIEAAGIALTTDCEAESAARAHRGFLSRVTTGRPALTLKLATSLDGRIATASGESRWITGAQARRMVHLLRASHDAVMVGGATARADDPALTVRGLGITHQTVRVVCDTGLSLAPTGELAQTARTTPVWLCHGRSAAAPARAAWEAVGARLIACATGPDGHLEMADVLDRLGAAGLTRVFCEGGGTLGASLIAGALADEIVLFSAGIALGSEGRPALGPVPVASLADAPRFRLRETRTLGPDLMQHWELHPA